MEDGPSGRQSEHSKTNDWRGRSRTRKIQEEASQKSQADETGLGLHRSAIWRTGQAADRANIQKSTVSCNCHGRSCTVHTENRGGDFVKESLAGGQTGLG